MPVVAVDVERQQPANIYEQSFHHVASERSDYMTMD